MTRVKALYRSWAIPRTGKQVYALRHRAQWLAKISEPNVRRRAELYYALCRKKAMSTTGVSRTRISDGRSAEIITWRIASVTRSVSPFLAFKIGGWTLAQAMPGEED